MTDTYDALVIGAGQAGLAAAYHLQQAGARHLVVDGGQAIGESWATRWDSLRLFTPARYSSLPGLRFPGTPYSLPTKDDVVEYLQRYAKQFSLPVQLGTRVTRLTFADGAYRLDATGGPYRARSVIVATGAYQRPHIPDLARELAAHIHQCHSSTYRSPAALPAGEVLVVGAGNSGAQIAMELADAGRTVWLSGRDTGSIPRRLLGRDVYDWLWWTVMRLTNRSSIGRRLMAGRLTLGDPLVGLTRRDLDARGIGRAGRTVGSVDGWPVLDDGRVLENIAAVVWCTGFRPEFTWIDLPILDARGYPRHDRGLAVDARGLGFVGLRYQHRFASSLLGGVGADAAYVVRHLTAGTRSTA